MRTFSVGFELLEEILATAPDQTHFLSPISASMALGMALNGADGETFTAMRETLGFGELSENAINTSYRTLLDLLGDLDPAVSLTLANGIWHRDDLVPRAPFVERVGEDFQATVEGLDFGSPNAADVINGWVESATQGRIDDLVASPIRPNLVAFLVNAVHFEGGWTHPFDPDRTTTQPFQLPGGPGASVELMDIRANLQHHQAASYAAVELPYGGHAYAMTVVVPAGDATPRSVLEDLAAGGWDALVDGLTERDVRVLLPRFELEWERTLNDHLAAMGMGIAFDGGADFTRMFENASPWIDEVKQKSFVRVDEEGTEAAAATKVGMVVSAPPQVRADRPFLFVIRERLTGTILFVGAVMEAPPVPS